MESPVIAVQASFCESQRLQITTVRQHSKDPESKMWCAVERHFVQDQRRRNILQAVNDI